MKVKMTKPTFIGGKAVVIGDEITLEDSIAIRLVSRKIAVQVVDYSEAIKDVVADIPEEVPEEVAKEVPEEIKEDVPDETTFEDLSYEKLTNKELADLCKQKGIELDKSMSNGKTQEEKRAYLISKLTEGE